MPTDGQTTNLWILYSMLTVVCWGAYGLLLHTGSVAMADPQTGRYKAFFWVGIAYFVIAIVAPAGILVAEGASWAMPTKGIVWSLVAGAAGAVGAFGVLLAFGAKGHPAVVMSIIFAGAPVLNAIVSLALHPPAGGWSSLRWQFLAGIVLAACGGLLVTLYKPAPAAPATPPPAEGH
jgi:hypothetical protein